MIMENSNMVEIFMSNAKKLKDSEECKNIKIIRCLTKEDRETLIEEREEAGQ